MKQPIHLPQLTQARFFAAFAILLFHFGRDLPPEYTLYFSQIGPLNYAVSFFFLLSGYILYVVHGEGEGVLNKKKFYWARFARIYPAYILAWIFVAEPQFRRAYEGLTTDFLLGASFLQAWIPGKALVINNPAWSLSVEAFFYLSFPFFAAAFRRASLSKAASWTLVLWVLNQAAYVFVMEDWGPSHYFPLLHFATFVMGLCFGKVFLKLHNAQQTVWKPNLSTVLSFALLVALFQVPTLAKFGHNGLYAPVMGVFILCLSFVQGSFKRLCSLPWLVLLGEISYGMYIFQIPVRNNWVTTFQKHPDLLSPFWNFYGYVIALIIFSYLMWRFVEEPSRKWMRARMK